MPVGDSNSLADAWSLAVIEDWQPEFCGWGRDSGKE
jgi:hypothetical protein